MNAKVIYLKLVKGIGTWIFIGMLFLILLIFGTSSAKTTSGYFDNITDYQYADIPYYENINDLMKISEELQEKIKNHQDESHPEERLEDLINNKKGVDHLIKDYHKHGTYYFRNFKLFGDDRYDFLFSSKIIITILLFMFSIFITYRVFGQDFAQRKSFFLIYNNNDRMRSYLQKMKFIFIANFLMTNLFIITISFFSIAFRQPASHVMHWFNGKIRILPFSEYMFLHFYIAILLRMIVIFFIVNALFTFILKPVISLLSAAFINVIVFIAILASKHIREVLCFTFGDSHTGLSNSSLIIIKVFLTIILISIFSLSVLHFKKRDLA